MSSICNNPKMIQRLLLTSFFIDNKIKPNTIIESFPCWNSCMWFIHCYISSIFMFVQQWHYLILEYFIKHALDFCKVRIKLFGLTFKGKQNIFSCHQPLHCLAYITKKLWCLLPFILNMYRWFAHWLSKDLRLLCKLSCHSCCPCWFTHSKCESSECKHVMSCICVG